MHEQMKTEEIMRQMSSMLEQMHSLQEAASQSSTGRNMAQQFIHPSAQASISDSSSMSRENSYASNLAQQQQQ